MATENQPEANYLSLEGVQLVDNNTDETHGAAAADDHAAEGHGDDHGADAAHGGEAGAHTEVAHEGESGGLPQLDPSSWSNQIFWLVLCLIAIYFLLSRIAIPRIGGTIEQRTQTIQRDLDRAAEMKMKAEEAEKQYNQALTDARSRAHGIAEQTKADIQADVDAATATADAEIAKQSEASVKRIAKLQKEAEASVETVAADVTKAILDTLAPAASDDKAIADAVNKVLKG